MEDLQKDERYYKIGNLNKWFAISSIAFLFVLVWTLEDDYSREWRKYQRTFRKMEIEYTHTAYSEKIVEVQDRDEYKDLTNRLSEARDRVNEKSIELENAEDKLSEISAREYRDNQAYRFAIADYDVAKYEYEKTLGLGAGNVTKSKKRLDELHQKRANLRTSAEASEKEMNEQQSAIDAFYTEFDEIQGEISKLTKDTDILKNKLTLVDPGEMSFSNKIGNFIRDLPLLDFLSPYYKIDQIVVKDVVDDVNFAKVPKVDRCGTCHLGLMRTEYENAENPYKSHPRLDLFLSSSSPHPVEEFGCTSCHGGRGRGTGFTSAVHMPSTPQQHQEWEEKYDWHPLKHWETPMYPLKYVEAGCLGCHDGETFLPGANMLNLGLNLVERSGCFGCHLIEKYKDTRRIGPDLNNIASKVNKEWMLRWIDNPKSFRHNTWMPRFFGQSNSSDPEFVNRTDQEIQSIVYYLVKHSNTFETTPVPQKGDVPRGEELVASLGCLGCHRIEAEEIERETSLQTLRRDHGSNLIGSGSKTSADWIYSWLKAPESYFPETKMPNLRLTDREAADIAAYLVTLKENDFIGAQFPPIDEELQNEIAAGFLVMSMSEADAREQVKQMPLDDKLDYNGKKLIRFYGCFSCHNIPGFENDKPIGTELSFEGDKEIERLDFGFVDIEHTRAAWFTQKLKEPRIFEKGRVKRPGEKLRMPNFEYTDLEIEAIVTVVLGLVEEKALHSKIRPRTPRNLFTEEGQWLVREYNCQGCHIIEDDGGTIRPLIADWLMKYDNRSETEANAVGLSFSPPNLIGEGKKVQTNWLFHFFRDPQTVRPWLKVRMPTFALTEAQNNILIRYFSFLDEQDFPFVDIFEPPLTSPVIEAGRKLFSVDYFSCASCHIVGDELPGGTADSWAPDFALTRERLKPDWIIDWLLDPQALLPGTKMPTYFDIEYFEYSGPDDILNGDENEQIKALRDYLLTIK